MRLTVASVLQEGTAKFANLDSRPNNKLLNRVSSVGSEAPPNMKQGTDAVSAIWEAGSNI